MSRLNYNITHFITSSPDIHHLSIHNNGIEVAFAGSSNVGKSSAINTLTNQKNLARSSKIPGCTKFINLFQVTDDYRLADLPGYGYSKVSKKIKLNWQTSLIEYLKHRLCLKGMVIFMDIRHPLKYLDRYIIVFAIKNNIEIFVLLTKADKLSFGACKLQLNTVRKDMQQNYGLNQVELFSSRKKIGLDKLSSQLNRWYGIYHNTKYYSSRNKKLYIT